LGLCGLDPKERRRLLARVINSGYERLAHGEPEPAATDTVEDLIADGESETVEFKSTARYNAHTGQADPRLEHVVLKTIAGFANGSGGTLLVGVN
jgi:Putative DNA-binding domain